MKSLKIKHNSVIHRLAKLGQFPKDGMVRDKEAIVHNELLRKKRDLKEITYRDYHQQQKDVYKDADFCRFARAVVIGSIVALLIATAASVVLWSYVDMFIWMYHMILAGKWLPPVGPAVLGWVLTVAIAMLAALVLAMWGMQEFRDWLQTRPGKSLEDKTQEEAYRLEARLERMAVRKAFWASIKNKTCFKMEIK